MPIARKGPLTPEAMSEILDLVRPGGKNWTLDLRDNRTRKTFHFTGKGVRLLHSGGRKTDRIGEILVQHGKLTPETRDELLSIARARKKPVGEQALELAVLAQSDIDQALRQQIEVHLSDAFFWPEAEFELRVGERPETVPPDTWELAVFCDLAELVENVNRRFRRWQSLRSFIRSDLEVFSRTGLATEAASPLDEAASRVLALVDGRRRVRDVVRDSQLTAMRVYEILQSSEIEGLIDRSRDPFASVQTRREEVLDEIRALEAERRERPADEMLLARLADAYTTIGEQDRAATRWRELARLASRRGAHDDAIESLRKAAQCSPNDYDLREEILDEYAAAGKERRVIEEGCELGNLYFRRNLLDRARALFGHLVYLAPREPRIRKLYALTLLGLGQRKLALWQLGELVRLLEAREEPGAELLEAYRQIAALDRRNQEVRRKLARLGGGRRVRWPVRIGIAAAAIVLLGLVSIPFWESRSKKEIRDLQHRIEALVADHDYTRARDLFAREAKKFGDGQEELTTIRAAIDYGERSYLGGGVSADMKIAKRREEAGEIAAAREIYARVARLDPSLAPEVREARLAVSRLEGAEEEAARLARQGLGLLRRDEYARARECLARAWRLDPWSAALTGVRMPVTLRTEPAGAQVRIDGEPVAAPTPVAVDYSIRPPARIGFRLEGFEDLDLEVTAPLEDPAVWRLERGVRWRAATDGPLVGPPAVAADGIWIGGRDRWLYRFSSADGKLTARIPLGLDEDAVTPVAAAGGTVVVGTAGRRVRAFDAETLAPRWDFATGDAPVRVLLDAERDRAVVFLADGTLTALHLRTGEVGWQWRQGAVAAKPPVLLPDGRLAVACPDAQCVVALDVATGETCWKRSVEGEVFVVRAADDGRLFLATASGRLLELRPEDGTTAGERDLDRALAEPPAICGDTVSLRDREGAILVAALAPDGATLRHDPREGDALVATAADDAVYAATTVGRLIAIDRRTGEIRWSRDLGAPASAAPVVAGDCVVVVTSAGALLAIPR